MLPALSPALVMGFYFYPRGGSAQVARYLCRALGADRWAPTLFAGSMGDATDSANAHRFFGGVRCESLDYTGADADWRSGSDPMASIVPMHGSFEDKASVPDRIFFELDDDAYHRQVASWTRFFAQHSTAPPEVVHLHHLTPMHAAVRELWPEVPVVTHLHGTELKMLALAQGAITEPSVWTEAWMQRMRGWAADSERLVVVSGQDEALARDLLPVDPSRISVISSGVDTDVFASRERTVTQRLELWTRLLVTDPQGWKPGAPTGSVSYTADDIRSFVDDDGQPVPVVLFAGRFMQFKRLQLLIEAHHARQSAASCPSVLVIVGGFPGEWEGEHPYDTVRRIGARNVFFVGWRDHVDLAAILTCSDVFAAPAVDEPFGLVYLEAMAAGVPPIATNTGGPLGFVNVDGSGPTGWLVPPDDVRATAAAIDEAVSHPERRRACGRRAAAFVRRHYSWTTAAGEFESIYGDVVSERRSVDLRRRFTPAVVGPGEWRT